MFMHIHLFSQFEACDKGKKIASSVKTAVSPVLELLVKAECDDHSVSNLSSPVFVRNERKENEGSQEKPLMNRTKPTGT